MPDESNGVGSRGSHGEFRIAAQSAARKSAAGSESEKRTAKNPRHTRFIVGTNSVRSELRWPFCRAVDDGWAGPHHPNAGGAAKSATVPLCTTPLSQLRRARCHRGDKTRL